MERPEIEEFAKKLVACVRDAAIQSCDMRLRPNGGGPIAKRWREAIASNRPEALAKMLIPDVVDSAIAHLLGAIDQELLRLSFTAPSGNSVDLTAIAREFGELSASYGASWREVYSKERYIDDLSDLKHFFDKPSDGNHK